MNLTPTEPKHQGVFAPNTLINRRSTSKGELETWLVPFAEWRKGIAELWSHLPNPDSVSPFDNAHGIVRYIGKDVFERMLCFPLELRLNGKPIGWASTYNISEDAIRIRGLYVKPEYRGSGFGFNLCDDAVSMWPLPFKRCYGLWRDSAFPKLQKKWGLVAVEGYEPRVVALLDHTTGTYRPAEYRVIYGYREINT